MTLYRNPLYSHGIAWEKKETAQIIFIFIICIASLRHLLASNHQRYLFVAIGYTAVNVRDAVVYTAITIGV